MTTATEATELLASQIYFYGGNQQVMECRDPEILAVGPAGSGKTIASLTKIHTRAQLNPGYKALIVRKTLISLTNSSLVSFQEKVLHPAENVKFFGGSKARPAAFNYPNGSSIAVGGMDDPTKVLSTEYDDIYCFPADTEVFSPSPVEKAFRRPYKGLLISIETATGHKLTGTPNHPVLTDKGWIALGLLKEGDYVVSRVLNQNMAVGNPDIDDQPATIAEIFGALSVVPEAVVERVACVGMNFHGDGSEGDIDIVSTHSQLHAGVDPTLQKPFMHEQIASSNLKLLLFKALSTLTQVGLRFGYSLCMAGGSFMKGIGPLLVSSQSGNSSLTLAEWPKSSMPQDGLDYRVADTENSPGLIEPAFPFEIALDCILKVNRIDSAEVMCRQVFSLQTHDHYFVANNIIVHNCNEATELSLEEWETLTSRLRNGKTSYSQIMGDCNPSYDSHWLYKRCQASKTTLITCGLEDNPAYYNRDSTPTEAGSRYLATLDALTGDRYRRLRLGEWVGMENAIYPMLDSKVHLKEIPKGTYWERGAIGVDYGRKHQSAVVAIQRDGTGQIWVRECVYLTGGESEPIKEAVRSMRLRYRISNMDIRVDSTVGFAASELAAHVADGGHGSRKGRTAIVKSLLGHDKERGIIPVLLFDKNGRGIVKPDKEGGSTLWDQLMSYHWLEKGNDGNEQTYVDRENDDGVAAMEYACEQWQQPTANVMPNITSAPRSKYHKFRVGAA